MSWNDVMHTASAILLVGCAGVMVWLARSERRHARRFLLLIGLYFGTKAFDVAVAEPVLGKGSGVDLAIDFLNLTVVALLTITLYGGVIALRRTTGALEDASREYHRAQGDYGVLIEHRLRNPLTVISSGAQTLLDFPDLEPSVRQVMLENIIAASDQLKELRPDAQALTIEERGLDGGVRNVVPRAEHADSPLRRRILRRAHDD